MSDYKERLKEIFEILKSQDTVPSLIFTDLENSRRFNRKVPVDEFGLVIDWDDTITTAGKENRSWIIMLAAMRASGDIKAADEIEAIRQYYRRIEETGGPLPAEVMHKWHVKNLDIYMQHELGLEDLVKQVKQDAKIYPEAARILKVLLTNGAKVCIVSAGIRNIIDLTLEKHGIDSRRYPNLEISAIELDFSGGRLSGYDPATIVTADSKSPLAKEFMQAHSVLDNNVVAVGDGLTDYKMLDSFSDASMILFCPVHKIGEMSEEKFLKTPASIHAFAKHDFAVIEKCLANMTI